MTSPSLPSTAQSHSDEKTRRSLKTTHLKDTRYRKKTPSSFESLFHWHGDGFYWKTNVDPTTTLATTTPSQSPTTTTRTTQSRSPTTTKTESPTPLPRSDNENDDYLLLPHLGHLGGSDDLANALCNDAASHRARRWNFRTRRHDVAWRSYHNALPNFSYYI